MTKNKPIDEVRFYEYLKDRLKSDVQLMSRPNDIEEVAMLDVLEAKIITFEKKLNKLKAKAQQYEEAYGTTTIV